MFGDNQEERDAACAQLCMEDEKCDLWFQSTTSQLCSLQSVLRNCGLLGVARGIVNLIIDSHLKKILNTVVKMVCRNGGVEMIMKILAAAESWTMKGSGSVNVDMPADFFDTPAVDFGSDTSAYNALTFPTTISGLESIMVDHPAMKALVKDIISGATADFSGGKVSEQLGTPAALFIGSLVKGVIEKTIKLKKDRDPDDMDTFFF